MNLRRLALSIVVLAAATVLPFYAAQPAAASSPMMDLEDLVRLSDTILIGTVEQVLNSQIDDTDIGVHTDVIIQLEHYLYGSTVGNNIALYLHGGIKGSQHIIVPGQVEYSPGENVLLFLFRGSPYMNVTAPSGIEQNDYYMTTGGNLGKWSYDNGIAADFKGQTCNIAKIGSVITAVHGDGSFNNFPLPGYTENTISAGGSYAWIYITGVVLAIAGAVFIPVWRRHKLKSV